MRAVRLHLLPVHYTGQYPLGLEPAVRSGRYRTLSPQKIFRRPRALTNCDLTHLQNVISLTKCDLTHLQNCDLTHLQIVISLVGFLAAPICNRGLRRDELPLHYPPPIIIV